MLFIPLSRLFDTTHAQDSSDGDKIEGLWFVMKSSLIYKERNILLPKPRNQNESEYGIMQQMYKEMEP
jgi:hypothetical protein